MVDVPVPAGVGGLVRPGSRGGTCPDGRRWFGVSRKSWTYLPRRTQVVWCRPLPEVDEAQRYWGDPPLSTQFDQGRGKNPCGEEKWGSFAGRGEDRPSWEEVDRRSTETSHSLVYFYLMRPDEVELQVHEILKRFYRTPFRRGPIRTAILFEGLFVSFS